MSVGRNAPSSGLAHASNPRPPPSDSASMVDALAKSGRHPHHPKLPHTNITSPLNPQLLSRAALLRPACTGLWVPLASLLPKFPIRSTSRPTTLKTPVSSYATASRSPLPPTMSNLSPTTAPPKMNTPTRVERSASGRCPKTDHGRTPPPPTLPPTSTMKPERTLSRSMLRVAACSSLRLPCLISPYGRPR